MRKEKTQINIFEICNEEGSFLPVAKVNHEQIRDMVKVALADYEAVMIWKKQAKKDGNEWNAIYKLSYDVLHSLAEAFLLFDRIKAKTHECLFAYLCEKHKELDFDWNFFERVRTKRNRSIYYGEPLSYENFKEVELQFDLYINSLKKNIKIKLKDKG